LPLGEALGLALQVVTHAEGKGGHGGSSVTGIAWQTRGDSSRRSRSELGRR
jgi:hypothetical protein